MHSHYSLRYGICSPEEVLDLYQAGGYAYALLADVNNTSAQLDFVRMAQKRGQKALLGVDFRNGATRMHLVIARNNKGIREINDYLAAHIHPKQPFPQRAPHFEHCIVVYPYSSPVLDHPSLHPHECITIEPHELNRFRVNGLTYKHTCIALPTQTFRNKTDFNTHRLLRAIDTNTLLSKLPKAQEAHPDNRYRSAEEVAGLYADFPELTAAAEALLAGCELHFEFGTDKPHKNQKTYTGNADDDERLIRQLCNDGLAYRYPNADEKILQRIDKELSIISEKQFTAYFLINWDITSYARSKGYFYVGRGSGANSVVAYLLRITDVDPIELDLYFERFINLYRQNPPDFDIDFSWTDRDDVTRYIFERFPNVCLLGAYNTFQ